MSVLGTPSLSAWQTHKTNAEPLQQVLARVFAERGQFRILTEQGLEEDIQRENDTNQLSSTEEGQNITNDDQEDGKEKDVYAEKAEMLKYLSQAQNEALTALDSVSLLLSKDAPKQGALSMSQVLKQLVPSGTLGFDKWPLSPPSPDETRDEQIVAKGWKLKSLSAAADSLLDAASRLEREVEKETKYWREVLSIKDRGWPIARSKFGASDLGVRFGVGEVGPEFAGRTFATFNTEEDGSISLDRNVIKTPKTVRVRILEGGTIVGVSQIPPSMTQPEASVEILVRRARDSLFEEELFHEISRETRFLLSYGIEIRHHTIILPGHAPEAESEGTDSTLHQTFLIDLIPVDEAKADQNSRPKDDTAQFFATCLRILLCHAHDKKLRRRSQIPPPLTDRPRPNQPQTVLRTILGLTRHHDAVGSACAYLRGTSKALKSAGLGFRLAISDDSPFTSSLIESVPSSDTQTSPLQKLLDSLGAELATAITLDLSLYGKANGASASLRIDVRTSYFPPKSGTEFVLLIPEAICSELFGPDVELKRLTYTSFNELCSYLNLVLSIYVMHCVVLVGNPGWVGADRMPEALSVGQGPHRRKLVAAVRENQLSLSCEWIGSQNQETSYVWDGQEGKKELRQAVKDFEKVMAGH